MTKLGPEAQALVQVGRGALRPTDADRQRVLEALRARIAQGGAPPPEPPAPSPAPSGGVSWPIISGLVVGAALIGAIAFQLRSSEGAGPAAPAPIPSPRSSATAPPAASALPEPAPPAASTVSALPSAESKAPLVRSTSGGLGEEVALLSRAETELHASRFGSALRLLDEYERRFPRGVMLQEDVAAKVQALCGLGRIAQAQAELGRLLPGSPHAARARAACRLK